MGDVVHSEDVGIHKSLFRRLVWIDVTLGFSFLWTWEETHADIVLAVRGVATVICSCSVAGRSADGRIKDVLEEFIAHVCVGSVLMFPLC